MFDLLQKCLARNEYPTPPDKYTPGTPLPMFELFQGRIPEEPGCALLNIDHDSQRLHAFALFHDSDIFSDTTADNQHSWELGDTFELFFRLPNHEDYYEIHSTPNNHRLQLHFEDYRTRQDAPVETHLCDLNASIFNTIDRMNCLWYSQIVIPFYALGTDKLDGMAFSLQRFNRNHRWREKYEISSTQLYPETHSGHTPYAWHVIPHSH